MLNIKLYTFFLFVFLTLEAGAGELAELMPRCAPDVHPTTLGAVIRTESGGYKFALADAGPSHLPWSVRKKMVRSFYPGTQEEAVSIAKNLISNGHIVAIGLTQVSSQNLKRLGLTVEQVLDPCTNLRSGGQILTEFYNSAMKKYKNSEKALLAAISAYNSGNFESGFSNGYVNSVLTASNKTIPEIKSIGRNTGNQSVKFDINEVQNIAASNVKSKHSLLLDAKLASIEVETF